ncbi:MAG: methyltransferase domain-containing protein [Verrucomicrobia bacterium]|nr:methyltransferase domain-containing protein [Verrucomicrobiota bacterium]MDA1085694.1 methyltransferase domain-containing protein [Verrucomicrobiota bacterium]
MDKVQAQRRFSRCSAGYDAATPRQSAMAKVLLEDSASRLCGHQVRNILELGCGTGNLTGELRRHFPGAHLIAVDFADEMLRVAQLKPECEGVEFRCADAEATTLIAEKGSAFDLIIANAAVQWFAAPLDTMRSYAELLSPGGLMSFSTFGPRTFHELGTAFRAAELQCGRSPGLHVLPFVSAAEWCRALDGCAHTVDIASDLHVEWFDGVAQFVGTLRAAGATMANRRHHASAGKAVYIAMLREYAQQFAETATARVPATFEHLYVFAGGQVGAGLR